jgi:RNA polymerase sigma-70 factor (ECF subfamily)
MFERHMAESEPRSDRDLVDRFRQGDREAFAALYHRYFLSVYRFASYMTNDRPRAAEITQDVFIWLAGHAAQFDATRGDLGAFLGGVARKFVHRQQRHDQRWLPLEEAAGRPGDSADFAGALERQQEAAGLRKAIAALPVRYREAVVLCDLEGRSYEEAAAALGCVVGTVRSRLFRARALLARKFQGNRERQKCL